MQKFQSIQALRALAANMVVVFHFVGLNARIDPSYSAMSPPFQIWVLAAFIASLLSAGS